MEDGWRVALSGFPGFSLLHCPKDSKVSEVAPLDSQPGPSGQRLVSPCKLLSLHPTVYLWPSWEGQPQMPHFLCRLLPSSFPWPLLRAVALLLRVPAVGVCWCGQDWADFQPGIWGNSRDQMVVLLKSQWLEESPEAELAAWPLGLVSACPTSAWSAASCPAPPVSAVPITGLVCGGHPEPATEGISQSTVVCQAPRQLFVCFCPIHCPPRCSRHLTAGPLHSEPALPKAIQM